MNVGEKEKSVLYILHGQETPEKIINSFRKSGIELEVIICSGSLRPPAYFPFIKDDEGRPYYGIAGINFYLNRIRKRGER